MFNNKKGYVGKSMSVRAKRAYENNEMPMSSWTKENMLEEIENIIDYHELNLDLNLLKKLTKDQIKNEFMKNSSWHHTGCLFNQTNFYEINEDWVITMTNEKLEQLIQDRKDYLEATKEERAKEKNAREERRIAKQQQKKYEKELEKLMEFSKYKTMTNFKKAIEAGRVDLDELREMNTANKNEKKVNIFKSTYGKIRKQFEITKNIKAGEAYDLYKENKLPNEIIEIMNNSQRAYTF